MQDISPEETRRKHNTQDTLAMSLETQNPTRLKRHVQRSSWPDRSRASSSSIHHPYNVDGEREVEGKSGKREIVYYFLGQLCVLGIFIDSGPYIKEGRPYPLRSQNFFQIASKHI